MFRVCRISLSVKDLFPSISTTRDEFNEERERDRSSKKEHILLT